MSMKQLFIQLMVGILFTLAACRNEVIPEETGNKIALSFNLYQAELTKADAASSIISEGTMLRAYAYTKDVQVLPMLPMVADLRFIVAITISIWYRIMIKIMFLKPGMIIYSMYPMARISCLPL